MKLLDRLFTRSPEIVVGGIYSIAGGNTFGIVKILATDAKIVHMALYKNHFAERPTTIAPSTLVFGTIHDPDGFGAQHLPLKRETFWKSEPHLIMRADVAEEELEGYNYWREAGGGAWE